MGLAVTVVTRDAQPLLQGLTVTPIPIPPLPPDPFEPTANTSQQQNTEKWTITRPDVNSFDFATTPVDSLPGVDQSTEPVIGPVDFGIPTPRLSASPFDPVSAAPRNNPARWVQDSDYRSG